MKIGLVGPSYQAFSLPFNAERSVNLYPVLDQNGRDVSALYGTPGLELFTTLGTGPIRGEFNASNSRAFAVSGSILYEVDSGGVGTNRGSLNQSSGNIDIVENGLQLAICDGTTVYIFTYATNVFVQVTDVDLPVSGTLTFLDGYFIVSKVGSGSVYISGLYDGLTWTATGFATAESSPDKLLRVFSALGQLWLLGDKTGEIWTNTGASAFPFQRISGGKLEVGILAPYAVLAINNAIWWLGKDEFGSGVVYNATGFSPNRVSTEAIELIIQRATDKENIHSYAYQEQGHVFIVFTGGGLETSLVYDLSTELWHERAYLNADGDYEVHRANCSMFAFGKHLVGDKENGNIYEMGMDTYSDNDESILRERIYTHLYDEGQQVRFRNLRIGFETGVGLQTGDTNPMVSIQFSKDGGRTYSNSYTVPIGAAGKYLTEVNLRRIGIAQQLTIRIRIANKVKVAICGSYLT